jgi:hypothetical protein
MPPERYAAAICCKCCQQVSPRHAREQLHDAGGDLLEAYEGGVARGRNDVCYALHTLPHRDILTKPAQHSVPQHSELFRSML